MRKLLAFDIGGTLIKYGVLTEDGMIIDKYECITEAHLGGASIVEKVKRLGRSLISDHDIKGICISTAGQIDSKEGTVLYASSLIPDYIGISLKKELETYFNLQVEVENDVNCAGLAESWVGTGRNAKSIFCLTIGTGIGGSFILDNKLQTGHNFSAGEIGYIPMEGNQFQELASTKTLIRNVAELKGISERNINGKDIFGLAKKGDQNCIQEINRLVYYLSKGISTIAYMMNPEMIIIGGGITVQEDYLYPLIMKQLEKDIMPAVMNNTKIKIAQNLNNAGMIGAVRHFLLQESMQPLKSVTTIIESNMHKLTKGEQRIAIYVVSNLASVPNRTISELAGQINVSEATITRFCKKLEFESFNKFRLMAKEANVSTRFYERSGSASLIEVKHEYMGMLKKFGTLLQESDIYLAKEKIRNAKIIYLYGTAEMSVVAESLKYKLMKKGIKVDVFLTPFQMALSSELIDADTLVIGINPSGYSPEIIHVMEEAKNKSAITIGVTSQYDSPLSYKSDIRFVVPGNNPINKSNNNSINEVSIYYLFDILCRNFKDSQ